MSSIESKENSREIIAAKFDREQKEKEFGLDTVPAYMSRMEKMNGMDHGPYHQEGDPVVHISLVYSELKKLLSKDTEAQQDSSIERNLLLAVLLHDTAKADTQQYDVISQGQSKLLDVSEKERLRAQVAYDALVMQETNTSEEEYASLSNKKKEVLIASLGSEFHTALQQKKETENLQALVVNFRGHDSQGAALAKEILQTLQSAGKLELDQKDEDEIVWIVEQHMKLLRPKSIKPKTVENIFAPEELLFCSDGKIENRRWNMLKMHVQADYQGTKNPDQNFEEFQKNLSVLENELYDAHTVKQEEQAKKERIKKRKQEINDALGMSTPQYIQQELSQLDRSESGPLIGQLQNELLHLEDSSTILTTAENFISQYK